MEKHKLYTRVYFFDNMDQKVEETPGETASHLRSLPGKSLRRASTETFPISTRVTGPMLKAIDEVLNSGKYVRVADYLRDLIRRDLNNRSLL